MKIGEDDRIALAALLTANAVMGAVDAVVSEGCSRAIRSMDDPHAFVVVPEGHDWRLDRDGIVSAMCSPDDAHADDSAPSHGTVAVLAEATAVPAAIAAAGLITRCDSVRNRDTPEYVAKNFAAHGRCLGELVAQRPMGMDRYANCRRTMFDPKSPINSKKDFPEGYRLPSSGSGEFAGDGRDWFLHTVLPVIGRTIPERGRLSLNPDDGGISIDAGSRTDSRRAGRTARP